MPITLAFVGSVISETVAANEGIRHAPGRYIARLDAAREDQLVHVGCAGQVDDCVVAVAGQVVWAWILTIPVSALLAMLVYFLINLFL